MRRKAMFFRRQSALESLAIWDNQTLFLGKNCLNGNRRARIEIAVKIMVSMRIMMEPVSR